MKAIGRRRRSLPTAVRALLSGVCVAASMPPWGWWPLALLGIAFWDSLLDAAGPHRLWRSLLVGVGWTAPAMVWIAPLSIPGYLAAVSLLSCGVALTGLIGGGRYRALALPATVVMLEWVRWRIPFGGAPLATLAQGQVGGPFALTAREVGALGLCGLTVVAGQWCASAARAVTGCWRDERATMTGATVVLGAALVLAPLARSPRVEGSLRIAAVQGGGPQGLRAVEGGVVETWRVFDRHMALTESIAPGSADLVLWPENTVSVHGPFEGSWQQAWLRDAAERLGAPISVGMVEDAPGNAADQVLRFHNTQIVIGPGGQTLSRTEKIRRVPFGEFIPMRGLLRSLGLPTDLVPKDATAGHGPPVLDLPARTADGATRAAVAISWEIFFSDTARDGVRHGGTLVLNPTNGSSYDGTVLQSQQVASSRLRAIETDRWVVQAAPTGFSAVIRPDGTVSQRPGIGEARVMRSTVELRSGLTWYVRLGDHRVAAMAIVVLGATAVPSLQRRLLRVRRSRLRARS